jgi:hypothetical protein
MSEEVERVELPMACTCAPDDAARVHALRASVKGRLAAGSAALLPSLVTDENFLSALAMSLRQTFARTSPTSTWTSGSLFPSNSASTTAEPASWSSRPTRLRTG